MTRFLRGVVSLTDEEIEHFCALASYRHFSKNETFVRAGEVCSAVLFIHKGIFRYYLLTETKEVRTAKMCWGRVGYASLPALLKYQDP